MIYLQNTDTPQAAYIPKTIGEAGALTLVLLTASGQEIMRQDVTELKVSELYYNIPIELPGDIQAGEYEYRLQAGDRDISRGLLVVGEMGKSAEYETTIKYEQYGA